MTAVDILRGLRHRGFQIDAAGQKLLVRPASHLTSADRAVIKLHIASLIAALESEAEWFEERAGILEFEAGMTRAEAEALAAELLLRARGATA